VYSATEVNRLLQYAQRMRDLADRLQARTRHIVQRESI
jgi:hypothetical protein